MSHEIETRSLTGTSASDGKRLVGYASRYSEVTNIGGQWLETILPGAFDSCISRGDDVVLLRDHQPQLLLCRTRSGNLTLESDSAGLRFQTADLPRTQLAEETLELCRRSELTGMSFSFSCGQGDDTVSIDKATGMPLRSIRNFGRVYDISCCSMPQYNSPSFSTRILSEVRSLVGRSPANKDEQRKADDALIDKFLRQRAEWLGKQIY